MKSIQGERLLVCVMQNFLLSRRTVLLPLVCAGLLSARDAFAEPPLTMQSFRDEVIAIGKDRLPDIAVEPGRTAAEVYSRGHSLSLNNIYLFANGLPPEGREAAIVDWLSKFSPVADARANAIAGASRDWSNAQILLRPKLIKPTPVMVERLIGRPFVDDLIIAYAIDLGDKDLYVSKRRFAEWNVTQEDVHAHAIANLEAMSSGMATDPMADDKGAILNFRFSDGYGAARLILPGLRDRLLKMLGTPFYAGVPARDLLIVWPKGHDEFRGDMAGIIRDDAATMEYPLSGKVFVVDQHGVRLA